MAVDSSHKAYDQNLPDWQVMRDTSAGERRVKEAGTAYLPMLGGQEKAEYAAYLGRTSYYNATGRTVEGLTGMLFRKAPMVTAPPSMDAFRADVSLCDVNLTGFAEAVSEEVVSVGRVGILVDFPRVDTGEMTRAQAESMNLRPFWSMYKAESILDWRVTQVGNKTMLSQVRLYECIEESSDEFESEDVEQIRVLDLDEELSYRQRLFRKEKGKWAPFGDDIYPEMGGKKMTEIPFIFVGPRDTSPHVCKPPLLDLANKNLDHYRKSADYTHAYHFLAAGMTPWGKGVKKEEIDAGMFSATGPTNIWLTTSTDAEFGVNEFSGAGMDAMRAGLNDAKEEMASLGARMLSPEKRQAEAAETAMIHRQGEMSVLASISISVSNALTKAMEWARDWMGLTDDVSVALTTDFVPQGMDPQMFREWIKAVQGGHVSQQEFFYALQTGEQIRADKTYEEHDSERETSTSLGML